MNAHVKEFATEQSSQTGFVSEHEPDELGILARLELCLAYAGVMGLGGFIGLIVGVIAAGTLGLITIGC